MDLIDELRELLGAAHVLTGADAAGYGHDWTGAYVAEPRAVLRPGSTAEVSEVLKLASAHGEPVVPVAGNTGVSGATHAPGGLMISLERMNRIREIRPDARIAIVEPGVVLSALHEAAAAHNLIFPLTFGARGSAMVGGCLSTNAGGSNVLRYGSTRGLCLGLEVVLASGEVLDLMSELHKDNSGYDLRDLFIGAEGTLGLITGAVLRLMPRPAAYATAMAAVPTLNDALRLLNRLQEATGGNVEAFEYMPAGYITRHLELFPEARPPFEERHDINLLLEVGSTAPRDSTPGTDGAVPLVEYVTEVLGAMLEDGTLSDAVVAQSEAQRQEMWARREAAAEIAYSRQPCITNDVCLPVDKVAPFLAQAETALRRLDPGVEFNCVAHLGDGNVHLDVYPTSGAREVIEAVRNRTEEVTQSLGGTFSAEHGIGLSKKGSMSRRKDPVALAVMRQIKTALDPKGIMNPGKVLPDPPLAQP